MIGVFTKNTLITLVTRVLTSIFGIGIVIIITRMLGPEGQGIYSLAVLLPTILLIFVSFGINLSSSFYLGKRKYPSKEIFGNNIILSVLISFSAVLAGLVIIFFFNDRLFPGVDKNYLILALSLLPLYVFFNFISHILLGLQKIKKYNAVSFLQGFTFLILVGILILGFHFGVKAVILAQILSFLLAGIVLFFLVKKETQGVVFKLNKNYLKDAIVYGFKAYLGSVFYFFHHRIDLILINFFINPVAVGFYYAAAGLAEAVWLLSASAATVLFPKVSSEINEKNLKEFTPIICRSILLFTLLISILLFIFGDWIIPLLYSEKFLESIQPFRILLIGTLFASGWQILVNDLSGRGKPILGTYIIGISVALNIMLNVFFIPKWGIEGAAWATVISYLTMFLTTVFIYSRISGNKMKDVILFKKSDLKLYKNILLIIKDPAQLL